MNQELISYLSGANQELIRTFSGPYRDQSLFRQMNLYIFLLMNLLLKEMYVYVLLFQYRSSPMRWHFKATILTDLIFEIFSF